MKCKQDVCNGREGSTQTQRLQTLSENAHNKFAKMQHQGVSKMKNTMQLLEKALSVKSAAEWHKQLNLSRNTLHTAKNRGNLSPAIAGALAEELGEDAAAWMVIAALEGERDSACKTRMIKKFIAGSALALGSATALAAPTVSIQEQNLCITSITVR